MQTIKLKSHENIPKNYTGIAEYPSGAKAWYLNGKLHRVDGPAIEYPNGSKFWFLNNKRHRVDGPACEYSNGEKEWYLNGEFIFELSPKDQPFLIVEETEDQVKILTATEAKWIKNIPGLKELENVPCK